MEKAYKKIEKLRFEKFLSKPIFMCFSNFSLAFLQHYWNNLTDNKNKVKKKTYINKGKKQNNKSVKHRCSQCKAFKTQGKML